MLSKMCWCLPIVSFLSHALDDTAIEQLTVTATRHEQPSQAVPASLTVLSKDRLNKSGITNLLKLDSGIVPSLRVQTIGSGASLTAIAIRGNGPTDPGQVTKNGPVALYKDGFLVSRAQGTMAEMLGIRQIEILRGPQGTLFGRNTTGGVVNLVSEAPSGVFQLEQSVGIEDNDGQRFSTHLQVPEVFGVKSLVNYVYAKRDGWLNNTAPGEEDFNAYKKNGGELRLSKSVSDSLELEYFLERSRDKGTPIYYQLYQDLIGTIGSEVGRVTETRYDISPLEMSLTEQSAQGLTITKDFSTFEIKSKTGYRKLDEQTFINYGGALYSQGFVDITNVDTRLFTQEVQLLGKSDSVDWLLGFFYLDEEVAERDQVAFSRDTFGVITGTVNGPMPLTTFGIPQRVVDAETQSRALFAQATWTPELNENLHLTVGLRYTEEEKNGSGNDKSIGLVDQLTNKLLW